MMIFFQELGALFLFLLKVFHRVIKKKNHLPFILPQILFIIRQSLVTVLLAGGFIGSILVIQLYSILKKYEAQIFLGGLNTSTILREVGPLIISFLLSGKIGAFITSELGTMRVTDQISAIECLGLNSIQILIIPRLFGVIIASFFLFIAGLIFSVIGAMIIASLLCNMNFLEFSSSIPKFINIFTLLGILGKSLLFGTIIGTVSCYQGYYCSGGARGVGQAVTKANVSINFYILIANFFLSIFLQWIEK